MNGKRILVVYYSLEGNTEFAADLIAKKTGADKLRLFPVKDYPRKGFRKFFIGGKSAVMGETPELMPYSFSKDRYDIIVFGYPVWASNVTPPVRTFIKENDLAGLSFAAFVCESGSGAEKTLEKLRALLGTGELLAELILIDPKDKYSEENEEKIERFCERIMK